MKKQADAFRSIGEVARLIGVAPHVLRYWETQFSQLRPMKRPDGRRYYRPEDVLLAAGLCDVLRDDGLTIRGAKKLLARDRGETVRARGAARLGDEQESKKIPPAPPADIPQPDTTPVVKPKAAEKRPHKPSATARSLPLFPDLDAARDQPRTLWLARLADIAARLRNAQQLPPAAYRQSIRLRDAITRYY